MEIGERIKKRREELGMSQEELAQKAGYKSRSSINKIEVDGRGLPQFDDLLPSKKFITLDNMRHALTEYLAKHDQDKKEALNSKEHDHIKKYRALDDHGQELIDTILAKEYERCVARKGNIVSMPDYLMPQAAHERTDIEVTDEMQRHDDDIMDDDDFWNK